MAYQTEKCQACRKSLALALLAGDRPDRGKLALDRAAG
jgi:hypothetical protein